MSHIHCAKKQKKTNKKKHGKEVILLKWILVKDAEKYTNIKIIRLKIKRIIIVEIRDIVEKKSEKIRNLKIRLTRKKQKTHLLL